MRVNVYAEEMTDRIEIISKTIEGKVFTGLRFYLELPASLPVGTTLTGGDPTLADVEMNSYAPGGRLNVRGPFVHRPGDDDSAAVTFWGKQDLRDVLRKALDLLDTHYIHHMERERRREEFQLQATLAGSPPSSLLAVGAEENPFEGKEGEHPVDRTKHAPKTMQYSDAPCQPHTCILTCLCGTEIRSDTWEGVGAAFDEHLEVVSKKETPHADLG
jgi:hypothetical protein